MKTHVRLALLVSSLITLHDAIAQGTAFTYQGRLTDSGVPFNGAAEFQFTLWDAASNGTQIAASAPSPVVVGVSNGLFSVPIDFGAGAFTGAERWLQIQARTALGPFITLAPRQQLAAAPYAFYSANAATAATVTTPIPDSLLSSNIVRLQSSPTFTGTVTAASFSGSGAGLTGITRLDSASGGPTGALQVDALGHIAIGTNDSGAALQIAGGATYPQIVFRGALKNGSGNVTNMSSPVNVVISGNRAYVTSYFPGSLEIFDISNPLQPVLIGQVLDDAILPGSPFQRLNGAASLFVTNNVAYVSAENDNAVTIINVSNPASPTKVAEIVNGAGGVTNLSLPVGLLVWSNKLFVLGFLSSALSIFDISNPSSPVLVREIVDDSTRPGSPFTRMQYPFHMALAGTKLFIAARNDHAVTILDVANPGNPVLAGTIVDASVNPASPFTRLRNANWVEVVGNVAYVAAGAFNTSLGSLTIIDVSNPANPTKLAELNDEVVQTNSPFTKLRGAWAVEIANNIAFVTSFGDDALTAIDVSNPAQPRLLKEFVNGANGISTLTFAEGLGRSGDTLYVTASGNGGALNMFSLRSTLGLKVDSFVGIGTATPRTELDVAGTISTRQLSVDDGMRAFRNWDGENGALEVLGDKPTIRFTGGAASGNQSWLLHVGSDGPGNFEILKRNGPGNYQNMFDIGTGGSVSMPGPVGIGTFTPGTALEVRTASNTGNAIRFGYAAGGAGNLIAGPSRVSIATDDLVERISIRQGSGIVGIGTTVPSDALLDVEGALRVNDQPIYLRGGNDPYHGLSYRSAYGGVTVDGPALYGYSGGVLGTFAGAEAWTLRWNTAGQVFTRGAINPSSDRNVKENFTPIDPSEALAKVVALPITKWNYRDDPSARHIGPMAQDFYAAFDVGTDDKHIATVDADGVALAAIQGLNEVVKEKDARIAALEKSVAELKELVAKLADKH